MDLFFALLVAGVERGSAYALVAVGFTVIYAATKVINFAQGQFLMVGGMFVYALFAAGLPVLLAITGGIIAGSMVGLLLDRGVVSSLGRRQASNINIIIATLAFGVVATQAVGLGISRNPRAVPRLLAGPTIVAGPFRVSQQGIFLILATLLIALFIWWIFDRTDLGLAIRSVGYDAEGAKALGLNVPALISVTVVASAALAAFAGAIVSGTTGASAYMGLAFGVKGFSGAVLGGLGNPLAGLLGGLLIGVIESFGAYYLPHGYGSVLAYFLLIVMLLFRPTGIFAEAQ